MESNRPPLAKHRSSKNILNSSKILARGRTWFLKAAYSVNARLNRTGFFHTTLMKKAKAAAKSLVERVSGRNREWVLATVHSQTMWIPNRAISQYVLRDYEPITTELFRTSIAEGNTVLDIGAYIGFFALLAARATGARGQVFAFEPAPGNFEVLRRNTILSGYQNLFCYNNAAADKVGQASFIIAEASDSNSFYPHPLSPKRETVTVDCITVDSFLDGRRADVIKIDAEGAEIPVLRGMEQTLKSNNRMRLFMELNPFCLKAGGYSSEELMALLLSNGFSVQLIEEASGHLRELDERLIGVPDDDPVYYANLYCSRE